MPRLAMGGASAAFAVFAHFTPRVEGPTIYAIFLPMPMMPEQTMPAPPVEVSIAIFAWNEAEAIGTMLESLFRQSIFAELARRGVRAEILAVLNGCTDATPEVAGRIFQEQERTHIFRHTFQCRVVHLAVRGKLNAWNEFVHSLSAREARFLILTDADILIHEPETLGRLWQTLSDDPGASVTVDQPCKDIAFKARKSWRDRFSLSASRMTLSADAQLCAQLYCIRAEIARNIYLPKDLAACEDGFIKALVCTDFLTHPVKTERIRLAADAAHTFEAYTSLPAVFRNQKRQVIGQTIVHLLVDQYLPTLPFPERLRLASALRQKEIADPAWLKRLIAEHLRRTAFFWRLYPGLLGHRFGRLSRLSFWRRVVCFPAAAAGFLFALFSSFAAFRALRAGCTDYWPQAKRLGLKPLNPSMPTPTH